MVYCDNRFLRTRTTNNYNLVVRGREPASQSIEKTNVTPVRETKEVSVSKSDIILVGKIQELSVGKGFTYPTFSENRSFFIYYLEYELADLLSTISFTIYPTSEEVGDNKKDIPKKSSIRVQIVPNIPIESNRGKLKSRADKVALKVRSIIRILKVAASSSTKGNIAI